MTTQTLSHFINGERVSAPAEHVSENPSDTRDIAARFPDGSGSEVDAAVAAARKAFPAWADASPEVRSDFLDRIGDTILKRRDTCGVDARGWERGSLSSVSASGCASALNR